MIPNVEMAAWPRLDIEWIYLWVYTQELYASKPLELIPTFYTQKILTNVYPGGIHYLRAERIKKFILWHSSVLKQWVLMIQIMSLRAGLDFHSPMEYR